jgi:molybdate/tungstate transport system substrate-binding protein
VVRIRGRRFQTGAIALLAAVAAVAGCGSTSASPTTTASGTSSGGTLIVFGAGTLAQPFGQEITAFERANPHVAVHSQFGASGDMTKDITQLKEPADVLGVADYSLIPSEMFGTGAKSFATWYVGFVSNEITFAYTSHSKGAAQLTSANWYKVLAEPGERIGRSTPAADPSGYQILQMLQLADRYYHEPGLSAAILKNSPNSSVADEETSLTAALQTDQIDYLAIYRSSALEDHFLYIHLPPQISLSDPALAKTYATVTVQGAAGPTTGKPIIYGLTIPTNAPNPSLARRFVAFVLSSQGQAIMRANGFVSISPALASSESALPAALRSLTVPWRD